MEQKAHSLDDMLRHMVRIGSSDLHLKASRRPLFRVSGRLEELEEFPDVLGVNDTISLARSIMSEKHREDFRQRKNADFSYEVKDAARFRVNVFQQKGTLATVIRRIPSAIPTIDEMNLPGVLRSLTEYHQGLILITGPTGSGKSTTLAAMLDYINSRQKVNVITLEDPIEFYHTDKQASVNQREMGADSPTFEDALRGVLRQDPDVILLGEMRDKETIETAMTAAETGHLVFSTLHTNSAPASISRIANVFPKNEQQHVLSQLAAVLVAVISQQLLRKADGKGRVGALEIMRNNPAISKNIVQGDLDQLRVIMENSVAGEQMQSMNQSLCALWANGIISREEAMAKSPEPDELQQTYDRFFYVKEETQDEEGAEGALPPKADMPEFSDRLDELNYYRRLYASLNEKGSASRTTAEERLKKQQTDWEWAINQLEETKTRLSELKTKVDLEEERWEEEVKKKENQLRQLELQYNRLKKELTSADRGPKRRG